MKRTLSLLITLFVLVSGCTWVKPTLQGKDVALLDPDDTRIPYCEKIGSTTAYVKDKLGFINRSEEKVNTELITLAKNEAATMGGNTIVAMGQEVEGRRSFVVYNCARW